MILAVVLVFAMLMPVVGSTYNERNVVNAIPDDAVISMSNGSLLVEGADGATGVRGDDGADGGRGADGAAGLGTDGADGADGADGEVLLEEVVIP